MKRSPLLALAMLTLLGAGELASAQLRVPVNRRDRAPPPMTLEMLQADFTARSGGNTVYFVGSSAVLNPGTRATLIAQAEWLRTHPHIPARIEGHSDDRASRDQALALGEKRAAAVRDFLVLNGVPAAQLTLVSWGKERQAVEGASEAARGLNRRVVTVLMPPAPLVPGLPPPPFSG